MYKETFKRLAPWTIVLVLCVAGLASHPYAYQLGRDRGKAEAMYDEMATRMPVDLQLMIALLRREDLALTRNEVFAFRSRLKGTLAFARNMVIPTERERGRIKRAEELESLCKQADDVDRKLGPLFHDPPASEDTKSS